MFKKFLATTALALGLLIGSTATAWAMPENGYFDDFEGNDIVGWGWDESSPNTAVPVLITVTNQETGETVGRFHPTAATYRQDLKENGIGNGKHGFRVTVDWGSLPDGEYLVEGWVEDEKFHNTKTYAKGAAAPAKEETPKQEAQTASENGLVHLGAFRTTGYCPCYQCSEGWGRQTSTGATARANHTIAVDPRVIPYGAKVMINGTVYTAEDRGGGVKGKHIDIFFDNHAQTRHHGSRMQDVYLVQ